MDWSQVPSFYAICPAPDCPVRELCLRWQAAQSMPEGVMARTYLSHHLWQKPAVNGCKAFASAEPQPIARGFSKALKALPAAVQAEVRHDIMQKLSIAQNTFYVLRRGERPLSPAQSQIVAGLLAAHGAPIPIDFDRIGDEIYWEV